jgi:hypothetical protein
MSPRSCKTPGVLSGHGSCINYTSKLLTGYVGVVEADRSLNRARPKATHTSIVNTATSFSFNALNATYTSTLTCTELKGALFLRKWGRFYYPFSLSKNSSMKKSCSLSTTKEKGIQAPHPSRPSVQRGLLQ